MNYPLCLILYVCFVSGSELGRLRVPAGRRLESGTVGLLLLEFLCSLRGRYLHCIPRPLLPG